MPKLLKLTKVQFERLFKVFSLVLLIDYPALPFFTSFLKKESFCDGDDIVICTIAALLFMLIVICFWCVFWLMNYAVFFMDDYRGKQIERKISLPFFLYVKYLQNSFKNKPIQSFVLELILVLTCIGVIYLFLYELFQI